MSKLCKVIQVPGRWYDCPIVNKPTSKDLSSSQLGKYIKREHAKAVSSNLQFFMKYELNWHRLT